MNLSWINVLFSVTKIFFFAVVFKLCYSQCCLWFGSTNRVVKILSVADWLGVTLPGNMIFCGLTVLQSLWLPKFFAELRETEWHWWDATRYHNAKPRRISKTMQTWSDFFFFTCISSEMKCHYICPGIKIILVPQILRYSPGLQVLKFC